MREDSILFFPAVAVVYCEWVHVPLVAFHHEMLEDGFGSGTLFGFFGISITILITILTLLKHIREIFLISEFYVLGKSVKNGSAGTWRTFPQNIQDVKVFVGKIPQ